MPKLALDQWQRDPLVKQLHRVGMPELMLVPTSAQPPLSRPHRYADQTRRGAAKRQLGGPKHRHNSAHLDVPLGGRCEASKTLSRDRVDVWLRARDAENRMRGSAFAAWAVDLLANAALSH